MSIGVGNRVLQRGQQCRVVVIIIREPGIHAELHDPQFLRGQLIDRSEDFLHGAYDRRLQNKRLRSKISDEIGGRARGWRSEMRDQISDVRDQISDSLRAECQKRRTSTTFLASCY